MDGFSRNAQLPVLTRSGPSATAQPVDSSQPPDTPAAGPRPARGPFPAWLLGLAGSGAALVLMILNLGTPAFWRDEAATTVAIRRTWPSLWQLMQGSEAPLVPYYAVLKLLTATTTRLIPGSVAHPEALERWPSAAAVALACGLLVYWLARSGAAGVAISTAGVMLLLSGTSRYGQEARPYALVMFFAVLATVLCCTFLTGLRVRWLLPYAVSVGCMVALHTLSASLLVAHLLAAVIWHDPGASLRRRLLRLAGTVLAAGAGAGVPMPLALAAVRYGTGAASGISPDDPFGDIFKVFLRVFNGTAHPSTAVVVLLVAVLLVLPVAAVVSYVRSGPLANLVRLAVVWALAPLAVLIPAALVRPNLMTTRYLVFLIPGWSLLGGLGLVAVAGLAARLLPYADGRLMAGLVVVSALVAGAAIQAPALGSVRGPSGHDEDVRVLLDLADRPEYRGFPIEVFPPREAIQLTAYLPRPARRLINVRQPMTGPMIWPQRLPGEDVSAELDDARGVIVLTRGGALPRAPKAWPVCRMASSGTSGQKWAYYVLEREESVSAGSAASSSSSALKPPANC